MKATRPTDLRELLREADVRPSRRLGQNFLIDENIARIAIDAAHLAPGAEVLEIGPGAGALTEGLLERGAHVLAVELDARLAALLRRRWPDDPRIEIREADALDIPVPDLLRNGAVRAVVSNLPYSDGTRILVNLITSNPAPDVLVVMLQTEVANRIDAEAGSSAYGLLALWTQRLYTVDRIHRVRPGCFYPRPEIESTLIRLTRRETPAAPLHDPKHHLALTRWAFQYRRKQLGRILAGCPAELGRIEDASGLLTGLDIPPSARPGDLTVTQWAALANRIRTDRTE